ncbi:MAG: hypothetical protein Q9171_000341 [Xanthocarpia ochracea]
MAIQLERFAGLLIRWFATAVIVVSLVVTVKVYQTKGNFTSAHKAAFNTLMLAWTLLLSLNFIGSFKELARALRGRISELASNPEQQQLANGLESLWTVWRLWRRSPPKPLQIFCVAWVYNLVHYARVRTYSLALNLVCASIAHSRSTGADDSQAAQISLALTSLTYTVDDGTDYRDTYIDSGMVNVSMLSCYFEQEFPYKCPVNNQRTQALAHAYGETSLATEIHTVNVMDDVLQSDNDNGYYWLNESRQYAYRFKEFNPDDVQKIYPFFTNRTITAESRNCISYEVNLDNKQNPDILKWVMTIPTAYRDRGGTTYIYRGLLDPKYANSPDAVCGSRCTYVWAYRNPSEEMPKPALYKCPVSISNVTNARTEMHHVPDGVARVAAASIVVQGRSARSQHRHRPGNNFTQYRFYSIGNPWNLKGNDLEDVGNKAAKFALGSIAMMANSNPTIQISGYVPHLGHKLRVYQPYLAILLSGIVVAHFAVFAYTVYWATRAGGSTDHMNKHQIGSPGIDTEHANKSRHSLAVASMVVTLAGQEEHTDASVSDTGENADDEVFVDAVQAQPSQIV